MRNRQDRHDWRYEPAPPAFAEARHANDDEPASLLSIAGKAMRDDAAARHRLARMTREAEAGRPLSPTDLEGPIAASAAMADDEPGEFLPDNEAPALPQAALPGKRIPAAGGIAGSKRLIATCGVLGAMAGGLAALSLPARYDATAELRLAAGDIAATFAGMDDQVRVITSGIVLNKVVDKLGLADDPAFNGTVADGSVLSLARSLLLRNDGGAASDAGHRHTMAASHLADSLAIARGNGPSAIAITATTGNGETAALIANTVAETFLSTTAAMHAEPQDGGAAGDADNAAQKLEVFLAQHGLASGNAGTAADALLKLDDQLSAARAHSADLNGKIAAMRTTSVDAAVGGGLPQEFDTNAMGTLRSQYLAIKRESDRATARLGPRNPERIALDTQLSGARDRISAELRRIVTSLQAELKQAVQTEQDLASRLAQTKLSADDMATLRTLSQAAAKAGPDRNEGAVDAADSASIVTKAYAPLDPSGPPRLPITLAGLLLGLAAGIGIGAVRGNRRSERFAHATAASPIVGEDRDAVAASDTEALISAVRRAIPAQDPIDAGGAETRPTETAETPYPLEDAMYPVYADQMPPFAPQQPGDYPLQQFQPPAYAPPQPYGAQPAMAQAMPQGAYVYTPYAPAYLWQAQPPVSAGFYPYPQPPQRMSAYPQPALPQQAVREVSQAADRASADQASLEEIRASLREFREAVRELAESRSRRRYF